jgi:hypothetical protein
VDHFVVLGEAHLRRILRAYARYYNDIRTHRSLHKDTPVARPVLRLNHLGRTKPAPRLEQVGDEHSERVQDRKHRSQ